MEGRGDFSQLGEYNIDYLFEKIKKIFSRVKPQIKVQSKEKKLWAKTPREGFTGQDIILKERWDLANRKGRKGRTFWTTAAA